MSAPVLTAAQGTQAAGLATALVLGMAFGFLLERGGMANARKLTAQFQLRDWTVIKVMFSALVTAMLATFWLGRLGVLNLGGIYIPETFLLPQAIGGIVFGAGFAIGGLCPGTACAAAATGRTDGMAVMAGIFAGALAFGVALPHFEPLFQATSFGRLTLPSAAGLPYGIVVAAVALGALLLFALAERVEGRMNP